MSCRPGDGGRHDVDGPDGGRPSPRGRAGAGASRPLPAAGPAAARAVLRRLPHERRGRGGDRPGPVRRPGGGRAGRTDLAPRAGCAARPDHAAGRRGPALAGGIGPDRRMDRERLPGGPVRPAGRFGARRDPPAQPPGVQQHDPRPDRTGSPPRGRLPARRDRVRLRQRRLGAQHLAGARREVSRRRRVRAAEGDRRARCRAVPARRADRPEDLPAPARQAGRVQARPEARSIPGRFQPGAHRDRGIRPAAAAGDRIRQGPPHAWRRCGCRTRPSSIATG